MDWETIESGLAAADAGDYPGALGPLTERHVQALWYDAALRPEGLRDSAGRRVRVVDPGEWNLEKGPDFLRATLEVGDEGRRVCGDVEIHLHNSDWRAHGHRGDPAYRSLAAHVTWHSAPPLEEGELPAGCVQICIGDVLRTRTDFSPDDIDLGAYPYAKLPAGERPCEGLFGRNRDLFRAVLTAAGRRRMRIKARRIKALLVRSGDREETFYREMLRAFGYKYNAAQFAELADTIGWKALPRDSEAALSVLQCAAGMAVERSKPWKRSGTRPVNSPERRMEAIAAIFSRGPEVLMPELERCNLGVREGQKAAMEILRANGKLGARRAAAALANVLVPFALAEERLREVPEWMFPEDVSAPVKLTAFRMLGRDHNPAEYSGNGLLIQGLLQLHRDYCLAVHPDCGECGLVKFLGASY